MRTRTRSRSRRLPADCRGTHRTRRDCLICTIEPEVSGEIAAARERRGRRPATRRSRARPPGSRAARTGGSRPAARIAWTCCPSKRSTSPATRRASRCACRSARATALVTVEREGVIESFVTRLSGREPVIEVPIKDDYAPERLRVGAGGARARRGLASVAGGHGAQGHLPFRLEGGAETALVDLSKPAFRLGVAQVRVGWSAQRLDVNVKPRARCLSRARARARRRRRAARERRAAAGRRGDRARGGRRRAARAARRTTPGRCSIA